MSSGTVLHHMDAGEHHPARCCERPQSGWGMVACFECEFSSVGLNSYISKPVVYKRDYSVCPWSLSGGISAFV